jgi:tetratricopeptide (TPR) repeat protein
VTSRAVHGFGALAHLRAGRADAAIADYDAAPRIDPKLANALYGRGLAKLRGGKTSFGEEDIAAAKALRTDIVEEFARYGVQ